MSTTASAESPASSIPVFTTIQAYRQWRQAAFDGKHTVGFVPTMGALHDGHLSLVQRSLAANDLTVVSIFVNPAQFAPHEDLATYPRTLPTDLEQLSRLAHPAPHRTPSAVFVPAVSDMYPSGITQDVANQKGTFVEVKGYGEQMEGRSRPTFFRGVATVVTKLFNIIQPTNAYFGQKDIQQGLLLRRLVGDLHLAHPTPAHLHIVPTARDPSTGLALSSRNAYLTPPERARAPAVYAALRAAATQWHSGHSKAHSLAAALGVLEAAAQDGGSEGVQMRVDYVEMNDPETLDIVPDGDTMASRESKPAILSAAVWIGRTRLIDNLILGDSGSILPMQ
ncbi:Pantoate-beta-alanine ligase [Auriscalpium vulgare]|uniref:Pantoate-beta-alanine ligase n=1 Tax=Auriscalpium vulgare TaxID=40419 RepID=A0ACB8RWL8_9AGAM|nr:Pantoate-beta-alanine ligase [Auriscalpium vulgare]